MLTADGLGYLTSDEPGIGGKLKLRPEDFVVEEVPLYDPEGHGDHLYLYIEKRRRLTTDVVRYLARHFDVSPYSVGLAGLKDKHAVTRQWFSVEHVTEEQAARFQDEHIQLLDMARHPTKLKRGNLRGNRFEIKVREVNVADVLRVRRMVEKLQRLGVPNFIGEQRFGYKKNNHLLGLALLKNEPQVFLDEMLGGPAAGEAEFARRAREAYEAGDYAAALALWPTMHRFERQAVGALSRGKQPRHAVASVDKSQLLFLVSAFQSAIFNRVLEARLRAGTFATLLQGDLAFKHDTRGIFPVLDPAVEQPRCDALQISPTGPMWGRKMTRAAGEVGNLELQALLEAGLDETVWQPGRYIPDGSRRAMRMTLGDINVSAGADEHGPYIQLIFELARGCFATTLLRELMKTHADGDDTDTNTDDRG